jgi:hypothetical protein
VERAGGAGYTVTPSWAAPISSRRLDTPETHASFVTTGRFVGRDAELSDLLALATAHAGGPAADRDPPRPALVTGPSGIGKSRLLRELKHRLQLAGLRNLTGRCHEDGGVPFQPFVEVLRQLIQEPRDLPDTLKPILDRLLHHSVVLNIKGESYRLKEKKKAGFWETEKEKDKG